MMPFKVLKAQEIPVDTTVQNELEDKYDSIITKAALSLTSGQYKQATDYYKEASLLKPEETYPYKMIKYVHGIMEEVAVKQKLSDRAQIRDDISKANQAIVDKSWDTARMLFSEVLTLNPEKADAEYARSKIQAIDLELQRIALRTPPKREPVVIPPPKNRREARERRKLAERTAILASSRTAQTQTQTSLPPAENVVVPSAKVMSQQPVIDSTRNKPVVTSAPIKENPQKSIAAPLPEKDIATAKPAKTEPKIQTQSTLPAKNAFEPSANATIQKPIADTLKHENAPVASLETKAIENPAQRKNVSIPPAAKEITRKSTETRVPDKKVVSAPVIKETLPKPVKTTPLSENSTIVTSSQTKETQNTVAITTPLSNEISQNLPPGTLHLADSSNYVKLICKDISFIGSNAYVKMLIQNYSETTDFLTDTLQVSIKKNNGSVKKLDQRFISSFPVVGPLKETIFVAFTDASAGVDPDDTFILQMVDKTRKTRLSIQIPWAVYKQQKTY